MYSGSDMRWFMSIAMLLMCSRCPASCMSPIGSSTSSERRQADVYRLASLNGSYDATSPISQEADVCGRSIPNGSYIPTHAISPTDANLISMALNLEYLEAEFFLFGAFGAGLDRFDPDLADGGPPPIGAQLANLDPLTRDIIYQFGLQEVGHIRAIKQIVRGAFPRVPLNLSREVFRTIMVDALGPIAMLFDAYANSLNYLLASYLIPYVGLTGYVGANPSLQSPTAKRLVAGLLAVESGQDAIIRALLYQRRFEEILGGIPVYMVTDRLSDLRNGLGHTGIADEGIVVPICIGAEGRVVGNVLAGDQNSVGYARTPEQIFRIVYGTGDASVPGGFFPDGARGAIAESYLGRS